MKLQKADMLENTEGNRCCFNVRLCGKSRQRMRRLGYLFVAALELMQPCLGASPAWQFSWASRTDRYGKPAGIFAETPFPLTESTTSYTIQTDEFPEGTTYFLGTKYYVDGASGNNANDGLSPNRAKQTIGAAVLAAGSGNKTILVRGAHDTFDGVYRETVSFYGVAGLGDTNRLILAGYGQERPTIDGGDTTSSIIRRGHASPAYITVQRLRLQNTQASGVRLGWDSDTDQRDQYFNCVDLWCYACGSETADLNGFATSGNCYYLNADYGFISHCTFERSVGHGVKVGDGASNCILEWSISRENGWWPGRTNFVSRTVAIDLPSDRDAQTNDIVRYCIASGNVSHGLEMRRVRDFRVYGNEISDFGHGVDMSGNMNGVVPMGITILATSYGSLSNNIVHSPYAANATGHLLIAQSSITNSQILIANNLLYEPMQSGSGIYLDYGNAAKTLIYNNTIVQSNATCAIGIRGAQGWVPEVVNNVIWQQGTGKAGELIVNPQQPVHSNNIYYYPNGLMPSWGVNGNGELVQDPQLKANPKGGFTKNFIQVGDASPVFARGVQLDAVPRVDINGVPRVTRVDVGAAQLQSIAAPQNVRVK